MPFIEIKALPPRPGVDVAKTLRNLCWELSKVMGVKPENIRAVWQSLEPGHYAEGDIAAREQPPATHPPIVHLTAFTGRAPETISNAIHCIADNLARDLKLDKGNVFVTYHETPAGRLFVSGAVKK